MYSLTLRHRCVPVCIEGHSFQCRTRAIHIVSISQIHAAVSTIVAIHCTLHRRVHEFLFSRYLHIKQSQNEQTNVRVSKSQRLTSALPGRWLRQNRDFSHMQDSQNKLCSRCDPVDVGRTTVYRNFFFVVGVSTTGESQRRRSVSRAHVWCQSRGRYFSPSAPASSSFTHRSPLSLPATFTPHHPHTVNTLQLRIA